MLWLKRTLSIVSALIPRAKYQNIYPDLICLFLDTYASAIVPDWNDPYFIERSWALLNTTAAHIRTNNLTCVRHVDIGLYGWWGEGHTSWITYPLPNGAQAATNESQYAIVDMHLEAFKGMQLYAMTDNAIMTLYAFSKSPTVGMRRDSLGNPVFDYLKTKVSRTRSDTFDTLTL